MHASIINESKVRKGMLKKGPSVEGIFNLIEPRRRGSSQRSRKRKQSAVAAAEEDDDKSLDSNFSRESDDVEKAPVYELNDLSEAKMLRMQKMTKNPRTNHA